MPTTDPEDAFVEAMLRTLRGAATSKLRGVSREAALTVFIHAFAHFGDVLGANATRVALASPLSLMLYPRRKMRRREPSGAHGRGDLRRARA